MLPQTKFKVYVHLSPGKVTLCQGNISLECNHRLQAISESGHNVPHFISQDIFSPLIKRDITDASGGKLGRGSYDKVVSCTANFDITHSAFTGFLVKLWPC